MQPIVFNRLNSTINRSAEAACLRAAYLLGGRPILAGDTAKEIYFKRDWGNMSLLHKLDMLIDFYKDDVEYCSSFANMRKIIKRAPKAKRKTKEEIVAYRKLEQVILDCWEFASMQLQDIIDAHGFGVIRDLGDKQVFGYLTTGTDPEKKDGAEITASDLMQLYVVDEHESKMEGIYNTPELFFLGNEFWAAGYAKSPIYMATDTEAASVASIYLQRGFTLPPINALTAAELQAARTTLQGGGAFGEAVDEWCRAGYDNEPPADRISLFQNKVLPAAAILQDAIENNPVLQLCSRQHSGCPPVEIWLGEMPVLQVWQYYRHFKVLNDDTWEKLQAQTGNPVYCEQRWPVMLLKMEEPSPARRDDEAESVKRYLPVE